MVRDVLAQPDRGRSPTRRVNLVMAHLTCTGGAFGGGERDAQSIMEYHVPAAIFPIDAHYVALGHLHRRQTLPAAAARCTTPAHRSPVDFGEQDNTNVVCLVEASPGPPAQVTDLPITSGRRLRTVDGTVEQLLADPDAYGEDFLRLRVTQTAYAGHARASCSTRCPTRSRSGSTRSSRGHRPTDAAALDRPPGPRRAVRRLLRRQPGRRPPCSTGCSTSCTTTSTVPGRSLTVRPRPSSRSSGFATFRDPTVVDFTDADYFALDRPDRLRQVDRDRRA